MGQVRPWQTGEPDEIIGPPGGGGFTTTLHNFALTNSPVTVEDVLYFEVDIENPSDHRIDVTVQLSGPRGTSDWSEQVQANSTLTKEMAQTSPNDSGDYQFCADIVQEVHY